MSLPSAPPQDFGRITPVTALNPSDSVDYDFPLFLLRPERADRLALGGGSTSPFSSSSIVSIRFVLLFRFLFDRLKRDTLNRFHSVLHGVERPLNLRLSLV